MVEDPPVRAGDVGSIRGLGRSSGEGNGSPLQYSCLENSMDGRVLWATVYGVSKSQTQLRAAAQQASLSFTISWGLLKLLSIESIMPSSHLIL